MFPLIALALLAGGCSPSGEASGDERKASVAAQIATAGSPSPQMSAASEDSSNSGSRILGKTDFTLRGKPACNIRFAYEGHDPEELFWEEPCEAVTAKLMTHSDLEALGRWDRLDAFARNFVNALPNGEVLYVEGSFSASVYPIGTSGETYEVPVAD